MTVSTLFNTIFLITASLITVTQACGFGEYACGFLLLKCCSCQSWESECLNCEWDSRTCLECSPDYSGQTCEIYTPPPTTTPVATTTTTTPATASFNVTIPTASGNGTLTTTPASVTLSPTATNSPTTISPLITIESNSSNSTPVVIAPVFTTVVSTGSASNAPTTAPLTTTVLPGIGQQTSNLGSNSSTSSGMDGVLVLTIVICSLLTLIFISAIALAIWTNIVRKRQEALAYTNPILASSDAATTRNPDLLNPIYTTTNSRSGLVNVSYGQTLDQDSKA